MTDSLADARDRADHEERLKEQPEVEPEMLMMMKRLRTRIKHVCSLRVFKYIDADDGKEASDEIDRQAEQIAELQREVERLKGALSDIIVRCEEGDRRSDWLPIICRIANEALNEAAEAAKGGE